MLEHFIRDIPQNMNALINKLKKKIGQAKRGKEQTKYLLVLDDVWSAKKWDELKNHLMGINKNVSRCAIGSKIIGETMSNIEMNPRAWLEIQKSGAWGSSKSVLKGENVLKLSFDHLSSPSLKKYFVYCKNTCWNILTFKIHDSVHDLSLSVSKFDTLLFQENFSLTLIECSHIRQLILDVIVTPKLYLLFLEIDVSNKLSKSFTRLKFLKFVCATNISLEVFGRLWTFIKALPKSTTKIYNLQTLRLLGLLRLTFLDRLENLISLKHLYFDRKELQPVNIGNLTCLQVLPVFFVGSKRGRSIKELGSLKELRGELNICDLGGLIIDFEGSNSGSSGYNSEEVMEGLQTHTNLQSLAVINYQGESFPSWMLKPVGDSNTGLFLLNILIELKNLKKVKCMGNEFYCNEGIDAMVATETFMFPSLEELDICDCPFLKNVPLTGQCSSIKKPHISKCKTLSKIRDGLSTSIYLKELDLKDCPNLSWIPDLEGFSSLQNLSIDSYKELEVLPITGGCSSLEKLIILGCESLSKIEDELFSSTYLEECFSLKILSINSCKELKVLPVIGRCSSLEKLNIFCCEKLNKIGDGLFTPSLQNLSIDSCNELEVLSLPERCLSLEKLSIFGCEKLSKIGDGLSTCACLKELGLYNCPNLSSIPNLEGIFSLQSLSINRCNELEVLPITGRCSSIEKLRISSYLEGFSSLQNLSINSYNELEVLPITRRCSSLEKLKISSCKNISKIGGRLSTSTYLKELDLYLCSNLSRIPDFEGFSSLQNLSIDSCKELARWSCLLPNMLRSNTSLFSLTIVNLLDLIWILDDSLGRLNFLGELAIGELQEFPCLSSFQYLSASLRVLELTELTILEFQGIKAFLEWLGNLSSLRYLYLSSFGKLKSLPYQLQLPTALEDLNIWGCEKESGPEWSKISHIPHICTNYRILLLKHFGFCGIMLQGLVWAGILLRLSIREQN
ncbi:hypothetical protein ES332_D09G005500v1 [Gossypium tomentosum]|uniref:Disease resistance R13L4/SHOC-2-like LRR domain-containing protein n=1 Tax=Gossypium tomentosum TaxID=34277 RepID=A0A5D2JB19_GOSTO|nr:hypothetical protein ES332_D09G005500v1 [Gossypium tomentosum]